LQLELALPAFRAWRGAPEMARGFLDDVERRRPPPAFEKPNALAKYHVCTEGVAVSQT
jgi:hypothetical protein